MVPHHILQQITVRTLWLLVGNPGLTREQAREIAAREVAQEQREKAKQDRAEGKSVAGVSQNAQGDVTIDNAKEVLLARLLATAARLAEYQRTQAERNRVTSPPEHPARWMKKRPTTAVSPDSPARTSPSSPTEA